MEGNRLLPVASLLWAIGMGWTGGPAAAEPPAGAPAGAEAAPPAVTGPSWTAAGAWTRAAGVSLFLAPLEQASFSPALLLAGEASLALPVGNTFAAEVRVPFLAHPAAVGSPAVGMSWAVHRHRDRAAVLLLLSLRAYLPVAPSSGDGGQAADILRRLRPWDAPLWHPDLTLSPGLEVVFATSRYAARFATAVMAIANGPDAGEVSLGYLLGFDVSLWRGWEALAEVGGRTQTGGGGVTDVGVAAGIRHRGARLTPTLRARVPLGSSNARGRVVVELGLEARF